MTIAWRSRVAQLWSRQIPLIAISLLSVVFWTAAALFTSSVAITGSKNVVLLRGIDDCGFLRPTDPGFGLKQTSILSDTANYAQECYRGVEWAEGSPETCRIAQPFPAASIDFTVQYNVACPFSNSSLCRSASNLPIRLTSELMNSNLHFGINAAREDQIEYRREMTCAALPDAPDGETISEVSTTVFGDGRIIERDFRYVNWAARLNKTDPALSVTWSNITSQDTYHFTSISIASNLTDKDGEDLNQYQVIDGLMPDQADLDIFIMTSTRSFQGSSSTPSFGTVNDNGIISERPFSAVACTTTHQFCNAVIAGRCTRKGGWNDIGFDADDDLRFRLWNEDGLTALQRATIYAIRSASRHSSLTDILSTLQSQALLARRSQDARRIDSVSTSPSNQTVQETSFWFATGLAALQRELYRLSTTSVSSARAQAIITTAPEDLQLCQLQKTSSTNHISIHFLALCLILAIGTFIITISLILPPLLSLWQSHRPTSTYARHEWQSTHVLHLLKSLFDSHQTGAWTTKPTTIPTTTPYEKFTLPTADSHAETPSTLPSSLLFTSAQSRHQSDPLTNSAETSTRSTPSYGATAHGIRVISEITSKSVPTERSHYPQMIASLLPGTSERVGSVRYTALSTSNTARERGMSVEGLRPPMVMHRDGERPVSWVMAGPSSPERSQTERLLRGHQRMESVASEGSGYDV